MKEIDLYKEGYQVSNLKFIDLFAGIGGFRIAFEAAGCECVFTSEINKFARHTYSKNYLEEEIHWRNAEKIEGHPELYGDIKKVDIDKEIPEFNILAAGFPCPTFSLAGISKRNALGMKNGLEDEEKGQLFFEITKILKNKKPEAFLLENVKNLLNHKSGETYSFMKEILVEELGYDVTEDIFDAARLVPQHRERVFIAGFREDLGIDFDIKEIEIPDKNPRLKGILEPNKKNRDKFGDRYTISDHLWQYLKEYKKKHRSKGNGFGYSIADPEGVSRTMSARYHKDGSEILISQEDIGENPRMLTEYETARLFGFPQEYEKLYGKKFEIPVSKTQAYQQFGNSLCVPLARMIAEEMVDTLKRNKGSKIFKEDKEIKVY